MDRATSQALLAQIRLRKAAGMGLTLSEAPGTFSETVGQLGADRLKREALRDVGQLGLTALGVGAGARGLLGLHQLLFGRRPTRHKAGPALLPLPVPGREHTEHGAPRAKAAAVTMMSGLPWYRPAAVMAGLGGLGLGWKGLDAVLDRRRKAESEHELDEARREFHEALLSQYDAQGPSGGPGPKLASATDAPMAKAAAALDAAYDSLARLAAAGPAAAKAAMTWDDLKGTAIGSYGALALPAALATGLFTYNKMQGRSRRKVIEKALRERAMQRYEQNPPPIHVTPEFLGGGV
jgi:hypothetical protein